MSLMPTKAKNIALTPIQIDFNKLYNATELVYHSSTSRLIQISKEIQALEAEQYKLEDIVDRTKTSLQQMKKS